MASDDHLDGHLSALRRALATPAALAGVMDDLAQRMLSASEEDRDDPLLSLMQLTCALTAVQGAMTMRAVRSEARYEGLCQLFGEALHKLHAAGFPDVALTLSERALELEGGKGVDHP